MATIDDAAIAIHAVIDGGDDAVGAFLGTLAAIDPDAVMAVMRDPMFIRARASFARRHSSMQPTPEDAA